MKFVFFFVVLQTVDSSSKNTIELTNHKIALLKAVYKDVMKLLFYWLLIACGSSH